MHHTIGRTERFEWARMGEVAVASVAILHLPIVRTLWFRYPLDPRTAREQVTHLSGRRLLLVFGDLTPERLRDEIEAARARVPIGPAGRA